MNQINQRKKAKQNCSGCEEQVFKSLMVFEIKKQAFFQDSSWSEIKKIF